MYQLKENGAFQMLPYDKFLKYGAQALSDEELLAIILRTGTQGEDALTLAMRVLTLCGREGILGLYHLTPEDLKKIRGIGEVKAVKLITIAELSRRMAGAVRGQDICFQNPRSVAEAYMERMRHFEQEHCMVIYLDGKDMRIADEELSVGTLNASLVSVREIFRRACRHNAASVILLHNHPSGNATPSKEDILMTQKLSQAAQLMEIPLLDHIIIGDNTYTSLKEKGVL